MSNEITLTLSEKQRRIVLSSLYDTILSHEKELDIAEEAGQRITAEILRDQIAEAEAVRAQLMG